MLKRYFWLAHVVLVTLAAALAATMTQSYLITRLASPVASNPVQPPARPTRPTRTAFTDYQVIVKRNIFNANPRTEALPSPPPPDTSREIRQTELQLKLVGTVAGANAQRYAIIEDQSNRGAQAVYQVGDSIQQALIVEIRPTCVVLDKGGQYESLCFQYDTNGAVTGRHQARRPAPSPRNDDGGGILRVDAATWRLSRELVLEQFSNLGDLSAQARVVPYVVQGQSQGFRLTRLQRGSLLQKIGLQNGDVIQKINGLSITSPDEALRAFQQLQNESTVRLELLRRNRATTLTYELR